jgi:hypothetical protein
MTNSRLVIAAVVAPLVPLALFVIVPVVLTQSQPYGNALPLVIIFSLFVSYMGLFCVGYPVFHLLRKTGFLSFCTLALAGTLAGTLVFAVFLWLFGMLMDNSSSSSFGMVVSTMWSTLAWGGGLGLSVAIPFALIAGITSRSSGRAKARR